MVKSPVEGSTAALVRLEDSVTFSNFVRPICLSDHHQQQQQQQLQQHAHSSTSSGGITRKRSATPTTTADFLLDANSPRTERLTGQSIPKTHASQNSRRASDIVDASNFIVLPRSTINIYGRSLDEEDSADGAPNAGASNEFIAPYHDDGAHKPLAAAFGRMHHYNQQFKPSPQFDGDNVEADDGSLPPSMTRHHNYEAKQPAPPHIVQLYNQELARRTNVSYNVNTSAGTTTTTTTTTSSAKNPATSTTAAATTSPATWSNCQTLGWSRQRDHLQRVQLQIADMAGCENVSIATVNSVCTKAVYQQPDCSEEEFAGSPMMCLLPVANAANAAATGETNPQQQWALVGLASWRIACAQMGIERPRMYDKIASNTAWIRDTISAT